ncbi:MAG TPA: sulfatase-like hydrolase/transferase, partial [Thermoanaerobaculia bacterium]|nr:sulfatase-like hydrolase/transferase [Thermoanaerobaculia bacterium]
RAPAALTWRVAVPDQGRLDCGLGALAGERVTYRVAVRPRGGERRVLLEETVADPAVWRQRSVGLAEWAGSTVELTLEAAGEPAGAVALWGAPVVSGAGAAARPDVVFYVIDGGGADLMSLYGYNRSTTPFLERLAAEGAVFERAYSNSTWTQPSTASFMTSLHHSVLGGLRRGVHSTPVPAAATTMAEHMRRGGYLTGVFTSNPNAGRVIGLERGVDLLRDTETEHHSTSSGELHERFWAFRAAYPGGPYWAHFQTTDVHEPNEPPPPFAGLYAGTEERQRLHESEGRLWQAAGQAFGTTSIAGWYDLALERSGVDRQAYFGARRDLYDETMAFQDQQLAGFVERLKRTGRWKDTILVVAADHGHPAGTFARFGRGLFEPQPAPWEGALFDSYSTRVPLLVVWPGHVAGGRRFTRPVSMIDVLPTLLELAGLPPPEVLQGRSLAPLLLGRESEEEGEGVPVVLDEFRVDERGEMIGNLEMIDGRWGASLEIGPLPGGLAAPKGRHAVPVGGRWGALHPFFPEAPRLLLYDLWNDPFARRAVNGRHPALVERYRRALLRQWRAHLALAGRFREAGEIPLTPEQLQQLRSLGYIQ